MGSAFYILSLRLSLFTKQISLLLSLRVPFFTQVLATMKSPLSFRKNYRCSLSQRLYISEFELLSGLSVY